MAINKISTERDGTTLTEALNRMMNEAWGAMDYAGGTRVARLPIDAYSTDNEVVVTASIPGANPDDVEITVEGDNLSIRGEISPRMDNVNYIFAERFHGAFMRTLQLNVPVDIENIEATFENGVLTLVLPKTEEVRPRVIKVKAQ